jgi:hypothetical protein
LKACLAVHFRHNPQRIFMGMENGIAVLAFIALAAFGLGLWHSRRLEHAVLARQSDAIRALEASIERHVKQQAELNTSLLDSQANLRTSLLTIAEQHQQQNLGRLEAAFSGIVHDFNERIVGQFEVQLRALSDMVDRNLVLHDKQRIEQMETMHHTRRLVEQIDGATGAFRELVADSTAVASIGAHVREALDVLGPRQEAIDAAIQDQHSALRQAADTLAALREQLREHYEKLDARSKRALDSNAGRTSQANALYKELNDNLGKSMAAVTRQLTAISSRLATDVTPMAQQLRRVADLSKSTK